MFGILRKSILPPPSSITESAGMPVLGTWWSQTERKYDNFLEGRNSHQTSDLSDENWKTGGKIVK